METIKIVYNWYNEGAMAEGTATIDSGLTRLPETGWGLVADAIAQKHAKERGRIVFDVWVIDPNIS